MRYGHRLKKIALWYMTDIRMAQTLAAGHLSLQNVKAFAGSITIPGRPEMRLGYPVWVEHMDAFYYVKSINHSFDFGGSFTTTLSLEGERKRTYDIDASSGAWTLQKDKIWLLTNKYIQAPGVIKNPTKTAAQQSAATAQSNCTKVEQIARDTGKVKSLVPGRYEIVDKSDLRANSAVPKGSNRDEVLDMVTPITVPFTDEEGYKLIGSFRYGRGIILGIGAEGLVDPDTTSVPSNLLKNEREAQAITNMKPVAAAEGEYMNEFFKVNNAWTADNSQGIETAIPGYLHQIEEENALKDPNMTAQLMTEMTIGGTSLTADELEVIISADTALVNSDAISKQSIALKQRAGIPVITH
jgi:hypothetical protein